ncbi:hypothetical protein G9B47_10755 [Micrococcus luteus]|uniref:hypothetical protein n=1 Tax=Micrococcus luteus TaxID=1270 RepID=UPI00140BB4D1|nr:hypothetical protein [Micrococcus luteus]NHQ58871.1 hypothetical protein [Micrococcus luteus]
MSEKPLNEAPELAALTRQARSTIENTERLISSAMRSVDLTGWRQQQVDLQQAIDALGTQRQAADDLADTIRQRIAATNALVAEHLPSLDALNSVLASAISVDLRLREQITSMTALYLNDETRASLNAVASWRLPAYRITALGALGVAAREAGLEDLATEASTEFEGLDETATAAAAEMKGSNSISAADVALGVRVFVVLGTLAIALWLGTGDDEYRWTAGTLVEWVGLASVAKGAESKARQRLGGNDTESGG